MQKSGDKKLHITTIHVKSEYKKEFVAWQTKLNAVIAAFSGFVSLEILSLSDVWTVIQRFSSEDCYQAWKESPQYKELFEELNTLLRNDKEAVQELPDQPDEKGDSFVTEVFVTRVKLNQVQAYRDWIAKIHQLEAGFPGFRGMYVQSPKDDNENWITFLQFDTPENLDFWLHSPERLAVLDEAKPMIASLENHRVFSPYAGWFGSLRGNAGGIPPVWKQTMLVLLVLFPIVMLELRYLPAFTGDLPTAVGTFIGNALSVMLIAWPMMPFAIWCLSWWLETKDQATNLLGLGLLMGLYLVEVVFFFYIF